MSWAREEKYLEIKIIQKSLNIDTTHSYDNGLLQRQETQKKIACPGSWYNNN